MPERYSGPSYDQGPDAHEASQNPDRLLVGLAREAAYEMLYSPDLLTREIARKILLKAEIKDRVNELNMHADDVTVYQELKQLGIFVVRDAEATFDYDDEASGFSIQKGDKYLDLHIPPVPAELRSRGAVSASLDLVGQYIAAHNLEPKYVMGVTYARMGLVAQRRFGFDIAYPTADSLPDAVVTGVERVYQGFTEAGKNGVDIGAPVIVFRDTDTFLDAYSAMPYSRVGGAILLGAGIVPPHED